MYVITRVYGKSAYVLLQWKRKVFKFFTGVRIEPSEFNERTGKINIDVAGATLLQKQVDDWKVSLLTTALKLEREGHELTQSLIRRAIDGDFSDNDIRKSDVLLLEAFTTYVSQNRLKLRPSTQRHYKSTSAVIKEFEITSKVKISVKSVDEDLVRRFQLYLFVTRHCNDNTVAKYMKRLQAVLNYTYPSKSWTFIKYKEYIPNVVFLEESEIQIVQQAVLCGYLDKTRDLLLFCCYTGMRYSDTQHYNSSWEQNGLIIYNQQKTDTEAMLPLFKVASKVVEKIWGKPTKD